MIGLDTNVLLRWLVDETVWPVDNPEQVADATRILSDPNERFFVNTVVLAEVVWVLNKPLQQRKSVLVDLLRRLIEASNVEIERRDAAADAIARFAAGGGGFSDHLIGAINRHGGCDTTLTFDRKAVQAADFTRLGPTS
ncbi:hypothetical protein ASG40_13510 [Methylobacterium sp. Leaf399]|uniref:PIN domain-containing protein n=1 Tax=unclassified Methylobacterium TaxID=2615210 RepID=UPI0006FE3089|nr:MULTISPECIES: type II toxin-antitoxin system VapC family toxin [unclassified Methylobacterium]KQP50927.1 hypothetical protein ASF39_11885 [Methylobacterium sp. Leaf108]KQT07910.1 hypothetical protein ASG40_13510 [Methylobacterium sp. Leaf399]KQT89023.1 hypothetical protein ASG59_14275 [Methylobacterium sp. Leaf466]